LYPKFAFGSILSRGRERLNAHLRVWRRTSAGISYVFLLYWKLKRKLSPIHFRIAKKLQFRDFQFNFERYSASIFQNIRGSTFFRLWSAWLKFLQIFFLTMRNAHDSDDKLLLILTRQYQRHILILKLRIA